MRRRCLSAEQVFYQAPATPSSPAGSLGWINGLRKGRIGPVNLSSRTFKPPYYKCWGRQQLSPLQPTQRHTTVVSPSVPMVPGNASAVSGREGKSSDASVCFLRHDRSFWASGTVSKQAADAFPAYPCSHAAAGSHSATSISAGCCAAGHVLNRSHPPLFQAGFSPGWFTVRPGRSGGSWELWERRQAAFCKHNMGENLVPAGRASGGLGSRWAAPAARVFLLSETSDVSFPDAFKPSVSHFLIIWVVTELQESWA